MRPPEGAGAREVKRMEKTIVVYFSHSGMNYAKGKIVRLEKGNTKAAAEKIAKMIGAPLAELKEAEEYPDGYRECVGRSRKELQENARPALKGTADVSGYENIILGYPNWCGTMPMPVWTFLESADFSGKKIYPFCTNEGSGTGRSVQDLQKLCPHAQIGEALSVCGSDVESSDALLKSWLQRNGF